MGRVKQALIEVDDLVCGCRRQGRTLNQTVRDLEKIFDKQKEGNTYLLDGDLIEFIEALVQEEQA